MMQEKLKNSINLVFETTGKAIETFEEAVSKPFTGDRIVIDGTIQRFEFTIELFCKLLKVLLFAKGIEVKFPKDVLKEAYQGKFIHEEQIWISILNDRNQTSHTYDEHLADRIYENCKGYAKIFRKTYDELWERKVEFLD